jgi:hypothetical protein
MMTQSVHARLVEIENLLRAAHCSVSRLDSLDGARNPFDSLAENASLHDWLKRAIAQADKLTAHFSNQATRKGPRS